MELKPTYVYILSSRSRNLYIGVTSDLVARVYQHKNSVYAGHTAKYNIDRLVYFEEFGTPREGICREKELKTWFRSRKVELIEEKNPVWEDLSEGWF